MTRQRKGKEKGESRRKYYRLHVWLLELWEFGLCLHHSFVSMCEEWFPKLAQLHDMATAKHPPHFCFSLLMPEMNKCKHITNKTRSFRSPLGGKTPPRPPLKEFVPSEFFSIKSRAASFRVLFKNFLHKFYQK